MPLDKNKMMSFYKVKVYFRHFEKEYKISTAKELQPFIKKLKANRTVIDFQVQKVRVHIYKNY